MPTSLPKILFCSHEISYSLLGRGCFAYFNHFTSRPDTSHNKSSYSTAPTEPLHVGTTSGLDRKPSGPIAPPTRQCENQKRYEKVLPSSKSGGIPDPTTCYIGDALARPFLLRKPQHLLVVLDLNGTLIYRPSKKNPARFIRRPHALRFLRYCVENFTVVIWSSARPENVELICKRLIPPSLRKRLTAIWARNKFGLVKEDYDLRVVCFKRLSKLWRDASISQSHPDYSSGGRWDQTNTVLIDDSFEKGRSEPFNLIRVPEFLGDIHESDDVLPKVLEYLDCLSSYSNISAYIHKDPFAIRIE